MISERELLHLGWLARIEIREDEREFYLKKLGRVLEYFNLLDEAETRDVPPTYHVLELKNVFREDSAGEMLGQDEALANAPRREKGYFKAPRIVGP